VKAVNLIPADLRRGATGIGRSGGAVYVILGAMGGVLLLATLWAVANHQVADRKAQLVKATQDATVAQARAQALSPYKQFADIRSQREQSIISLARTRFDWPTAMSDLASALPSDVQLSTFTGSPAGAGGSGGASSAPATGTGSLAAGAVSVHLTGCAGSHTQVGDVIYRLRGVPGVSAVTFASSAKNGAGPQSAPGGSSGGCHGPQFDLSVAFNSSPGAPASAGATTQPASTPGGSPSAAASRTPAATSAGASGITTQTGAGP
jgi:Tfp pilus assembly protein PilN